MNKLTLQNAEVTIQHSDHLDPSRLTDAFAMQETPFLRSHDARRVVYTYARI